MFVLHAMQKLCSAWIGHQMEATLQLIATRFLIKSFFDIFGLLLYLLCKTLAISCSHNNWQVKLNERCQK